MKLRPSGRRSLACLAALLAACIPMFFSACGGGMLAPTSSSQSGTAHAITSIVPDTGSASGGNTVTITGTDFTSGASVSFGGTAASKVSFVSSTQLRATTPAHVSGTVSVAVTNADGSSANLPNGFTYTSTGLTVGSVSPASGAAAGGTAVTITGTGFASGASVSFGGVAASAVSFVSSTQLKATTPAHAGGAVSVAVTDPDGSSADLPSAFTYTSGSLNVSSVSPASGPSAGGTTVTITGTGFDSGTSVSIGGLVPTSVTVASSTTIHAVTPAHSFGSVSVTVTTSGGKSAALASGYTYHAVSLSWSAPSSTPKTIAGYNVYRAQASNGPFARLNGSSPLTQTAFSDATVQSSTTYYYEVKSVDSNGTESPPDGPITAAIGP